MHVSRFVFAGIAAVLAGQVQASQLSLKLNSFVSSNTDSAGFAISPYSGTVTVNGVSTNVAVFCDDLTHTINIPGTYTENVSSDATNFAGARFYDAANVANSTSLYHQMFYLASFLTTASGLDPQKGQSNAADIQDAIWLLTYPHEGAGDGSAAPVAGSKNNIAYWVNQATANASNYSYANWTVMSDPNYNSQTPGHQELFYNSDPSHPLGNTPEPGTIAMMCGGLGLLACCRGRRLFAKG